MDGVFRIRVSPDTYMQVILLVFRCYDVWMVVVCRVQLENDPALRETELPAEESDFPGGETRTRVPNRRIQNHNQPFAAAVAATPNPNRNFSIETQTPSIKPPITHQQSTTPPPPVKPHPCAQKVVTEPLPSPHRLPSPPNPFTPSTQSSDQPPSKPIQPPPRSLPFPFAAIFAAGEGGAAAALVHARCGRTRRRWEAAESGEDERGGRIRGEESMVRGLKEFERVNRGGDDEARLWSSVKRRRSRELWRR
ncbi:hypothetical protein Droror1_Dr00009879 [Drosera rotundifolia]